MCLLLWAPARAASQARVPASAGGRARSEGICRFTALVAEDNMAMAGLLRKMDASLAGRSPGTVEYEIRLTPP